MITLIDDGIVIVLICIYFLIPQQSIISSDAVDGSVDVTDYRAVTKGIVGLNNKKTNKQHVTVVSFASCGCTLRLKSMY